MGAYSWTGHFHYLTIGQISLDVMGNDLKIQMVITTTLPITG